MQHPRQALEEIRKKKLGIKTQTLIFDAKSQNLDQDQFQ